MKIKNLLFTALVILTITSKIKAQIPNYVPSNGLVGWWPFNGNANDESSNGNNGTENGATLTIDRNGNTNSSYLFDGVNDYIQVPHNTTLNTNTISVSIWFKTNNYLASNGAGPHLLSKRESSGWGNSIQMNVGRYLNMNACWADWSIAGNSGIYYYNSSILNTSEWYNLIYTHDGNNVKLFLNGNLVQTITSPGLLTFNTLPLWFGARPNAGNNSSWFNGSLDDIGIWNRILTDQEIQALYNGCNVIPSIIVGNLSPATLTSANYSCNNNMGSSYQWTVTNGVITSGQGTSNVSILWGEEGVGTLAVVETNTSGCSGNPSTLTVDILCSSTTSVINGPLGPNALTPTSYSCDGNSGSSFQWIISNGVITSGQGTNSVSVLWAGTGLGTISVQETTSANCQGDTISVNVVVIPTGLEEINQSAIKLYPNPANTHIIIDCVNFAKMNGYQIKIQNFLGQQVFQTNLSQQINNLSLINLGGNGIYFVHIIDSHGDTIDVKKIVIQ